MEAPPGMMEAQRRMADNVPSSDLMGLMLKRWWVLALGVAVGLGLALLGLRVVTPTYEATATQLIKGVPGTGTGAPYLAAQFAVARAKSYPAFIYSATVLDNIRSDLGQQYTDASLREQLSASNPVDTPLVHITATGDTPEEAQNLANSASRHLARFITQIETVSGSTPVIVETAVQAGLPATPSTPQPSLYIALGLTGGLALGVVAMFSWRAIESSSALRKSSVGRRRAADDDPRHLEPEVAASEGDQPVAADALAESGPAAAPPSSPIDAADDENASASVTTVRPSS